MFVNVLEKEDSSGKKNALEAVDWTALAFSPALDVVPSLHLPSPHSSQAVRSPSEVSNLTPKALCPDLAGSSPCGLLESGTQALCPPETSASPKRRTRSDPT